MAADLSFRGKRVLVTGAGGFIGSHLVERLVEEGADVTALLRYTSRGQRGCLEFLAPSVLDCVRPVLGDIRDLDAVRDVVKGSDVVFHLAALIGIPYSYAHPQEVIDTNVTGTANVLLAARENGAIERVVLTSTSEVYGSARYVPMDEAHPLQAQSPYAATKIAGDALGESFYRSFETPVVIVRPFNAFGPRQSARAVIPTIIAQALSGSELRLGALDTVRDFTYVEDTARGFLEVARCGACVGEVVNLGTGRGVSIREVVRLVGEALGKELRVVGDERRLRPEKSEVSRLLADASKAERLTGWRPAVSFEEGLRRTIAWVAERLDLYRPQEYAV
ncbi:MAG TPA: SDR family NAD(P)-dependent oxidoreductase [Dehalococcoidia bacterium]|nr:SDR family NAD(P)-dependent oxidoreductase [Dehalococcoidia bacterium]